MAIKKTKTIRLLIPIYGLGWVLNTIKLDNKIEIRFINDLNKENELLRKSGFNWRKYKCVLDIKYAYDPDKTDEPYPAVQFLLNEIQASLRVFHTGAIGFAGIISQPQVSPFPLLIDLTTPSGRPLYKIDKNKLSKFPEFYQKFKVAYEQKPVAFDYFSHAQNRYVNKYKAIDYCISLESLFVPEGDRGGKKAFILQGLRSLGLAQQDIQMAEDLYDYRNAVVHANRTKQLQLLGGAKYTYAWFEECTELMRKIMSLYVEKPWYLL